MPANSPSPDQILPETRWVAVLVIPFLVVAFVILYLLPHETERLFAWKLQPTMSAMMLGAAYAGGIYFFTALLRSTQWHRVKVGLLPVTSFAGLLGIATILHWDRFNHSHISFYAWAGLYFTAPIIVFIVWLRNRAQDAGAEEEGEATLPIAVRWISAVVGAITLAIGLFLFVTPAIMIQVWAWTLSPLTARVMGAMFALPGVVGLGMALDARWSAARIIVESQGFSILLILLAALRARAEIDWANWTSWAFVLGLGGLVACLGLLHGSMQGKRTNRLG